EPRGGKARPWLRRVEPDDREEHQAFEKGLIELRGMPDHAIHPHAPRHIRGLAPELAVDEVADPAEEESDARQRHGEIEDIRRGALVAPGVEPHRGDHTQHAAVEGHAALPDPGPDPDVL